MENLKISFEVVAPLIIIMSIGNLMRRTGLFTQEVIKKLNAVVFKTFLPVLIFYNVYTSDIKDVTYIKPAIFSAGVLAAAFVITMLLVPVFEKDNKKRGVMVQGMCRSNFVIYGIPLSTSLCGEGVLGTVSIAVAIVIPVINILSVISLEVFRGKRISVLRILKSVIKNPLLIGSVLGIAALLSGVRFPMFIEKTMGDMSGAATPIALMLLGGSIDFAAVKNSGIQLFATLFVKLVALPAAGFILSAAAGFSKTDIAIFTAVFASPTAVSSYTMAQQMDGDDALAAQIVALGTAASIFTVFVWVFILKQIGLA